MKSSYIIILLSIALIGCGPSWHAKRVRYHERMYYAKGGEIKKDTVYIEKVVTIPEVKLDTIFQSKPQDTVYLTKERLRIKYVNLPGDSVFIEVECKDSVITIKEPVYINKTIQAESKIPWWVYIIFGLSGLVIVVLAFRR